MLILSIFTLVTVIVWIVFDVYHAHVTSHITTVQQEHTTPLDPTFDLKIIQALGEREQ